MAKQDKLSKALVMLLEDLEYQGIEYVDDNDDWGEFVDRTKLTLADTGMKFSEDEEPLNMKDAKALASKLYDDPKIRAGVIKILTSGIERLGTTCFRRESEDGDD